MALLQPFTRREFVHHGLGLVGIAATVPSFLFRTVQAMAAEEAAAGVAAGRDGRILVVVQLAGGNDGLNTVVPFTSEAYYRLRPRIAVAKESVLRLSDDLGLHPEATGLRDLWDDGRLAVVQGVGYPNPNRSHFVGTRIWQTASPEDKLHEGWLGRYFDSECKGHDPDPKMGVALVDETPLGMMGQKFMPIATDDPRNWQFRGAEKAEELLGEATGRRPVVQETGQRPVPHSTGETPVPHSDSTGQRPVPQGGDVLSFLRRSTLDAAVCVKEIRAAARKEIEGVDFPRGRLGESLGNVARMIAAGMTTRVYYVSLGGFDTHANQEGRHANLMREVGGALRAFVKALEKTGHLSRTLIMTFSEFGRRASENASGGTDHGEAAPMFLMGGAIKGGLHGQAPDLSKLHRGDVAFDIDFRRVYATVLKDWLRADAEGILGGKFEPLPIVRA